MTGKSTQVSASNNVNRQSWVGTDDGRYGYGAMYQGFRDNAPDGVVFDDRASVQVYMGIPQLFEGRFAGQFVANLTMWETTVLPSEFVRYLKLFDRVVVPCEHNAELFGKHHGDVVVVPLGVDTSFWHPMERPVNDVFRFHAAGSLWRRKGLDVLVDMFNKLGLPDAELHIKIAPHAREIPTHRLGNNIVLHTKWLNQNQQRDWFNQADCFVAPSRGEGFGLIPLQAIAMGIPTVVSRTTGQEQFAHLASGSVGYKKVRADTVGFWDEPNRDELAELLYNIYTNRETYRAEALENAPRAAEFSWDKAATKLCENLPVGTKLPAKATWEEALVTVTVNVLRPVKAHIGGADYLLKKGEQAVIPDGAYQVLYDSGAVEMV